MPKGDSNKFVYDTSPETGKPLTTHMWYDGTQHPWEFKRVWHLEPSLTDPNHVYAGVEDAALFESKDGGENWKELAGYADTAPDRNGSQGAGGMCMHSIILDPKNPEANFHRHLGRGRVPERRSAGNAGSRSIRVYIRNTFRSKSGSRSLRSPHRDASVAARTRCSCETLGRHAQR